MNQNKYNIKKLKGGSMHPILGSNAVEFKGQSHAQGGIKIDAKTEVEGGETMDDVLGKDYFFSDHLKLNGSTFAALHKRLLAKNASQGEIEALAERQELVSGRSKTGSLKSQVLQAEYGGYRTKYEEGGPKKTGVFGSYNLPIFNATNTEAPATNSKIGTKALSWEEANKIIPYLGSSEEIPKEYMKYLRPEYPGSDKYVFKDEYMRHDMSNPYGGKHDPETAAQNYIKSNTGQFKDGQYFADEKETGNIKLADLEPEAVEAVKSLAMLQTPVAFNNEHYTGKRTKSNLTSAIELASTQREDEVMEGIVEYNSWYDIPSDAGATISVKGTQYKKNDEGTEWVNMDGSGITFSEEEQLANDQESKQENVKNIELAAEESGDYTAEEKEIMRKQQILVDAGHDLGDSGPNNDGVDGDWGSKSKKAQYTYDVQTPYREQQEANRIKKKEEEDALALKEEEKALQAEKDAAALSIQNKNEADRIAAADLDPIDMKDWALVNVGGEEVYVPFKDRFKYSSVAGQKNSNPVEANEAYQKMLGKRDAAIGSGLGEGTYTDSEGNHYEKDSQNRWRLKSMEEQEFGDPTLSDEWTILSPDQYPNEGDLTKYKEKKTMFSRLKDAGRKTDYLTLAASAAQLIPAYMAYKDKPDYMDNPGKMPQTKLERVNFNNDRMTAAGDYRALNKGLDLQGAGPATIQNKMMAYSKKQAANMAITAKETKANVDINNREELLNQEANKNNIKNRMVVDEFNAAADAATTDRKIEATQAAMTTLAGMNTDRMQYNASENYATAIGGETGVMSRFDIRMKAMQIAGTTDVNDPRYIAAFDSLNTEKS